MHLDNWGRVLKAKQNQEDRIKKRSVQGHSGGGLVRRSNSRMVLCSGSKGKIVA
jgi:hypothetical protein